MDNYINTPKEWTLLAERDLNSAEFLANNMHPIPTEIVCFHCQQAVEKYLKGYLAEKQDKEPPYTHDLVILCKLCEKTEPEFSELIIACSVLVEFGVKPRYDYGLDISESDMQTALSYSKRIRSFVKEILPDMFVENL